MRRRFALAGLAAACHAAARGPHGAPLPPPAATATLIDSTGARVGVATFSSADRGARLGISVAGLTPGPHGIHIHEQGMCTPPDFSSAGAHLNPERRQHGLENPAGPHAGDLPNLMVDANGSADTIFTVSPNLLAGGEGLPAGEEGLLFRPGGTAVVVHAERDDQRTDPSGGSGARAACGVVERGT
jgi:Cu-Zn family superoxide dismutase